MLHYLMWCAIMRFSTCFSLVSRRGFFIYQNFFSYDLPITEFFTYYSGRSVVAVRYYALWFEQHHRIINYTEIFFFNGFNRSILFGHFILHTFPAHLSFIAYSAMHILRLFKILTYRGKCLYQKLPVRGQRTRSNSAVTVPRRNIRSLITQFRLNVR